MSSVPYVPPEIMKNVAATSGQNPILAALLLVAGRTFDGTWTGNDSALNSFSSFSFGKEALKIPPECTCNLENREFSKRRKIKISVGDINFEASHPGHQKVVGCVKHPLFTSADAATWCILRREEFDEGKKA